jgi:hypothetical protein
MSDRELIVALEAAVMHELEREAAERNQTASERVATICRMYVLRKFPTTAWAKALASEGDAVMDKVIRGELKSRAHRVGKGDH